LKVESPRDSLTGKVLKIVRPLGAD
jgi:hypothetical protein